jgi:predicted dienelactone hydrolase
LHNVYFHRREIMTAKRLFFVVLMVALVPMAGPAHGQDQPALPLSEPGPFAVGRTALTIVDPTHADRDLVTEVWYPAILSDDDLHTMDVFGFRSFQDAEPDTSGAPYPLIVQLLPEGAEPSFYDFLAKYLSSQGLIVAAVAFPTDVGLPEELVDPPTDVRYVLDQLAALAEGDLVGMMDTTDVGVWGVTFGGYPAALASGARVDPAYFADWAANNSLPSNLATIWNAWDEIAAYHAQIGSADDGTLWSSFSDERIRAVLLMPPCFGSLFGERGLAAATVPTMLMAAEHDLYCPYESNPAFMADHLGSEDVFSITLVGETSNVFYYPDSDLMLDAFRHFTVAFFGYYLQGREDYAGYLTADYVNQFEGLAWGASESP